MQLYPNPDRFKFGEFFVEFLGSLVPGFLFTFLATIGLGSALLALYCSLVRSPSLGYKEFTMILNILGQFRWETILFTLAFSYVVGFGFFRQDPKLPDQKSVWRNRKLLTKEENAAVWVDEIEQGEKKQERKDKKSKIKQNPFMILVEKLSCRFIQGIESFFGISLRIGRSIEAQFPYKHMHQYLKHRGLANLAKLVKWENKPPYRTKAFINLLKVRLKFAFPDKCGYITRNEAHVRLMSSMWYMSRSLQLLAIIGLILVVYAICRIDSARGIYFLALIFSLLILVGTLLARHTIERFFHYQRVREIIYVLATADFAATHGIILKDGEHKAFPQILRGIYEDENQQNDARAEADGKDPDAG